MAPAPSQEKIFKLRNTTSNLYWNGSTYYPGWSKTGKEFKTRVTLDRYVERMITTYNNKHRNSKTEAMYVMPSDWIIEEHSLVRKREPDSSVVDLTFHLAMQEHLVGMGNGYSYMYFYQKMMSNGAIDKISHLLVIKPSNPKGWGLTKEDILNARAQLRLLGVKTRTFREYNGMFGMMSRDQAFKARLTMDISEIIDLDAVREKVKLSIDNTKVITF